MPKISLAGKSYEVLETLNNVTLADSFVKNKIGSGHGEAKLYVGNEGDRVNTFFDDLNRTFFFLLDDFNKYMVDAREEYLNPQQEYVRKESMPQLFESLQSRIGACAGRILRFSMTRVSVNPPRVYLKSDSPYYDLVRAVGLPNISYLSFMKIKDAKNKIFYYCRIFVDYKSDILAYDSPFARKEEARIQASALSDKKKTALSEARQGQGEYRRKLLDDVGCCPFTLVNDERLLIASHIKPWAKSTDSEKTDPKNGFALTPTYDRLFDQGYITFQADGKVKVSPWISPMNQKRLHIYDGMDLPKLHSQLDGKREQYLQYHRTYVYKG